MSLQYGIGLDTSQIARDAEKANQIFKGIGDHAKKQASVIDSSFRNAFAIAGGMAGLGIIGRQILDTTAKFEKFGIVLKNTLGEIEGQKALDMIAHFAATTPFQLDEVTGAFVKMANQGFTPTRNELIKLGDLASSTGKSFDQLAEAILDAQTGEFERLKEFGIKARQEGDKVTFTFKDQQTTVDKTNDSIRNYILSLGELEGIQGANAKISESLTGQMSNLQDKLEAMFNEIGQQNSGLLYSIISAGSAVIEHYDTIAKVLMTLIATYGAYRASLIVATVATNGLTLAESLWYAKSEALLAVNKALNATMLKNPYVLVSMGIMSLVGVMGLYANSVRKAISEKEILNDLESEVQKTTGQEISRINNLKKILNDSNKGYAERKTALDQLKEIAPDYHATLTTEGSLINNNAEALDNYVKKLVIAEKIKIAASKQSAADDKFNQFKEENKDVLKNAMKKQMAGEQLFAGEAAAMEIWTRLAQDSDNYAKVIEDLQGELVNTQSKTVTKGETPEQRKLRLEREKKDRENRNKKLTDLEKERLQQQENLDNSELELLRSKITNKKDLIDLEYEQSIEAINKAEKEYKERSKGAGIINPDLSIFNNQRDIAGKKRVSDKKAIDDEELKNALEEYKTLLQKKEELEANYNKKRILLSGNPQAIKALTDSYKKELDSLQDELLDNNGKGLLDLYLFGDGEDFIQDKIKMAFPEIKSLSEATFSQLEQVKGFVDSIEFTPEQLKSFEELGIDVQKLLDNLKKAKSEETDFIDTEKWADILDLANQIAGAVGQLGDSLQGFGGAVGEIGSALSGIAGQVGNVTSIFKEGATTGDIISGGVSGLSSLIGMVANQVQANKEAQSEWNAKIEEGKHQMALMRIEAEGYKEANLFGVENPYSRAIAGAKQYAQSTKELYNATKALENGQTQTGTKKVVDAGNVAAGVGSGAAIGAAVGSFIPVIGNLVGAGIGALVGGIVGLAATKTVPVFESLKSKYGEVVDSAGNLNQQLIADYDKLDEETKQLVDNWEEIKAKQEEAQEMMKQNFSDLAGDLGSSLSDALVDAFKNDKLYSAIDTFDAKMNDVISGIVSQLIFNSIFGQMFSDLESKFNESFSTGGDQNIVDELLWFNENYQKSLDAYNQAMEAANKEMKNSGLAGFENVEERTGATKGFAQASQDSINELNGRFTAVQGHTFRIAESVEMLRSNSGQALKHLAGIETNTSKLDNMDITLTQVKSGIDTINLKGVKIQ